MSATHSNQQEQACLKRYGCTDPSQSTCVWISLSRTHTLLAQEEDPDSLLRLPHDLQVLKHLDSSSSSSFGSTSLGDSTADSLGCRRQPRCTGTALPAQQSPAPSCDGLW
jgi:hypothetical protein